MVKLFTIVAGETWNCHKTFVENLAGRIPLTEVPRVEECDVILEFCPVTSRPGPDIDTALRDIPANKPAVLVVMHHTCDPNRIVFDSSNYVTQSNVVSVDCVFYEGKGFFRCLANEEAVEKTQRYIGKYSKEHPSHQVQGPQRQEPLPDQGRNLLEPPPGQVQGSISQSPPFAYTSSKSFLEEIRRISQTAANNMHAAGITDAQILTFTLPELIDLLPGMENFKKRREIMDLIGQKCEGQLHGVLLELRQHRQLYERQLHATLETNELLRQMLHKLGTQEELPRTQLCEEKESRGSVAFNGQASATGPCSGSPVDPEKSSRPSPDPARTPSAFSPVQRGKTTMSSSPKYNPNPPAPHQQPVKVHISGDIPIGRKSFLGKLGLPISECSLQQCQVILILCPVFSQTGTEIKAALNKIPDKKAAILVVIHHVSKMPYTIYEQSFLDAATQKKNIVETVNYIWHQTKGDIPCNVNNQAISKIKFILEAYSCTLHKEVD